MQKNPRKYLLIYTENSVFQMPRKVYKRGVKPDTTNPNREKRKRGLSKKQISVMYTIDRSGNIIAEPIVRGMIGSGAYWKVIWE